MIRERRTGGPEGVGSDRRDGQYGNVARAESIQGRVRSFLGEERYTAISERCAQVGSVLRSLLAVLFVVGVNVGAFVLVAALEESSTASDFFRNLGMGK